MSLTKSLKVLGNRIREARKRKGFSQEGLALAADIDRSFMGQVERGQRNVSFATLYRLAVVIGCDLADLCRDIPGIAGLGEEQLPVSYFGTRTPLPSPMMNEPTPEGRKRPNRKRSNSTKAGG